MSPHCGRRAPACGAILALAACGAPPVHDGWWRAASALDDADPLDRAAFDGARGLVEGFDETAPSAGLGAGDRALFAMELRDDDAPQRWLLLVEVTEPSARSGDVPITASMRITIETETGGRHEVHARSEVAALKLTRFDDAGAPAESSELYLLRDALEHGFARACVVHAARGRGLPGATPDELDRFGRTVISLQAVLAIVQSDDQLAAILQRVARTPSFASIVAAFGVSVAIVPDFESARVIGSWPTGGDPLWRIPLTITANDEPAVRVLVDVVEPRSPWSLAAGVVRLSARRPGDARARLVMELLAARRGGPADA